MRVRLEPSYSAATAPSRPRAFGCAAYLDRPARLLNRSTVDPAVEAQGRHRQPPAKPSHEAPMTPLVARLSFLVHLSLPLTGLPLSPLLKIICVTDSACMRSRITRPLALPPAHSRRGWRTGAIPRGPHGQNTISWLLGLARHNPKAIRGLCHRFLGCPVGSLFCLDLAKILD